MFLLYFYKHSTFSCHYHIEPLRKWGTTPRRWEFLPQVILINPLFLSTSYSFNFERRNEGFGGLFPMSLQSCLCYQGKPFKNSGLPTSFLAVPEFYDLVQPPILKDKNGWQSLTNSPILYSLKSSQSGITS